MALHVYNDYRNNWDGPQPYRQELAAKLTPVIEQRRTRTVRDCQLLQSLPGRR